MKYFSQNIKILRKSKRYIQDRLAELLGVKPNSISNYEHGVREPTIDQIGQFIKIFDISADDLLFKDLSEKMEVTIEVHEVKHEYNTSYCQLCKQKDHTIQVLEELNELLRDKVHSKVI